MVSVLPNGRFTFRSLAVSDVRKFLLEPDWETGDNGGAWHLAPGIYTEACGGHSRRLLLVWGDAMNRQMCCPIRLDGSGHAEPSDVPKSVRELKENQVWVFLWPLEATDALPGKYGPTVAAYIARVEAGGPG